MVHPTFRNALIFLIRMYQASGFIWKPRCRFFPTCSHYAQESISLHGVAGGLILTVRRLAHCHPWGASGYDPVPQIKKVPL